MAWLYVWLGLTAVALVIEFITSEMVSIWFAGGGLIAMIISAFGVEWYVHVPVFIVLSLTLLLSFRKMALKYLDKGDIRTNADSAIGKEFTLLSPISFNQAGTIKINDVIWNVDTKEQEQEIPEGVIVRILEIKGNKYIVEEVK